MDDQQKQSVNESLTKTLNINQSKKKTEVIIDNIKKDFNPINKGHQSAR